MEDSIKKMNDQVVNISEETACVYLIGIYNVVWGINTYVR